MEAATWAIVALTLLLIIVTGLYAWQTGNLARDTARMANVAESEAEERRAGESDAAQRIAVAISAEIEEIRNLLGDVEQWDGMAATSRRNFIRLSRVPRSGRVFDGLLTQLAVLRPDVVQRIVGVYTLVTNVSSRADAFLSRSPTDIMGDELERLAEDLEVLFVKADQALTLLREHTA